MEDHIFSTLWLAYFSVQWWVYTVHDGKQTPHSAAQEELIKSAVGIPVFTDEERAKMAQELWKREKGFAATILIVGWLLKVCSLLDQISSELIQYPTVLFCSRGLFHTPSIYGEGHIGRRKIRRMDWCPSLPLKELLTSQIILTSLSSTIVG